MPGPLSERPCFTTVNGEEVSNQRIKAREKIQIPAPDIYPKKGI